METRYFYYSKGLVYFAMGLLGFAGALVLTAGLIGGGGVIFFACFAVLFGGLTWFLLADAVKPAMRHVPVLIADEKGITDIISWGLIEWSNIASMNGVTAQTSTASFKQLRIALKDKHAYAGYNNSWWIRVKMKWCRVMNKADIVIDIDALDGGGEAAFRSLQESKQYYNA